MCLSLLVVALAGNYPTYLLGRTLIGVVTGGFWSMSAAVVMHLVPEDEVPKALAIFNGGNALATVIATPLGSYLGGVIGWRGASFCLVSIALLAFALQWLRRPALPSNGNGRGATIAPGLLRRPLVAPGMLADEMVIFCQVDLQALTESFEPALRTGRR